MPASRRPAPGEVHRRDLPRRRRAEELRARPARLHRHVRGEARLRAGDGHGLPRRDDRLRGADPARRQEAAPRRHLRRPAGAPQAGRHDRRDQRRPGRLDRDAPRRQRAALPDRELGADPRRRPRRQGDRPGDARRPDRLERPLLQPRRRPVRALVEARRPRGRDGGRGALHRRRAQGRAGRLPPDRQRHHRRGRVQAGDGRRDEGRRRPDDARGPRHRDRRLISDTVFLVNPASANGSTGRRWAEMAHRAATKGLEGDTLFSERPGPARRPRPRRRGRRREAARRRRRRRLGERGRERDRRARGRRDRGDPARHRLGLLPHLQDPAQARRRDRRGADRDDADDRPRPRRATGPGTAATPSRTSPTSRARA